MVTETVDAALICFGLVQPSLAVRGQIAYIIVITNSTTVVRGAAVVHRKGESVILSFFFPMKAQGGEVHGGVGGEDLQRRVLTELTHELLPIALAQEKGGKRAAQDCQKV